MNDLGHPRSVPPRLCPAVSTRFDLPPAPGEEFSPPGVGCHQSLPPNEYIAYRVVSEGEAEAGVWLSV